MTEVKCFYCGKKDKSDLNAVTSQDGKYFIIHCGMCVFYAIQELKEREPNSEYFRTYFAKYCDGGIDDLKGVGLPGKSVFPVPRPIAQPHKAEVTLPEAVGWTKWASGLPSINALFGVGQK